MEERLHLSNVHVDSGLVEAHMNFDHDFASYVDGREYSIFGQCSFPEKRPLREIKHPSILDMVCLNATGAIDLRLVYLRRKFSDAGA